MTYLFLNVLNISRLLKNCLFIENIAHVSRLVQFKPVYSTF